MKTRGTPGENRGNPRGFPAVPPQFPCPLIPFGLGSVGRALLRQIGEQRSHHREKYDLRIRFLVLCDSSGAVVEPQGGFTDELLDEILQHKGEGSALASHPLGQPYKSPGSDSRRNGQAGRGRGRLHRVG